MSQSMLKIQQVAFMTLIRKHIARIIRIWTQTLLPPAITMTLYFLIFGSLIGSQVREIDGFSYVQYITPGLVIMTVITSSYSQVVSSFFSEKFSRSIEELLVSPMWNITILLGFISGGVIRGVVSGFIVLVISLFFTHLSVQHIILATGIMLLASILLSLLALINAIYARTFDDISIIPSFVLTPLTYLGGVFFSITLLPGPWQIVAMFNPFLYLINAFRYSFLGTADVSIFYAICVILAVTVALFFVCWYMLCRGVGLRT